jgi:predicted NBD/HSP70 family sugar kinase
LKSPRRTVDLRQVNYQVILRKLYLNGPMSRLEISSQTDLSPSTVTNVTSEMFDDGVLIEKGMEESLGGRPRTILDINPEYGYLVGVDLGETHVQLELFDLTRHKLATARKVITAGENSPENYVQVICERLNTLFASSGISREAILGMGVGVPGIVEHNGQVSVAAPMWDWKPVRLLEILEDELRLPVYVDNGAKAMALAESWFGAGRGVQDMVVILIGTGIGAGVITKGILYRGATNSAGEWGHTKIELDGRSCRCGSRGCLEAYVGAPGIITTLNEISENPPALPEAEQLAVLTQLVQSYKDNDPLARQVFQTTAQVLGAGIANLVNLFNPELIIIGGWAGLLVGEAILDDIIRFVKKYSLPLSTTTLQIGLCQFGQDAICTGAACLVLEEFLSLNEKFIRQP